MHARDWLVQSSKDRNLCLAVYTAPEDVLMVPADEHSL